MRKAFFAVAFSLGAALAGCDIVAEYSGDGRLIDNGPSAATDRYVLDLGPISLKESTSSRFKLKDLPKTDFVIGIELRSSSSKIEHGSLNPVVAIALLEDGKTILSKEGMLSDWTWSIHSPSNYGFVYGRNNSPTHFTPRPGKNYELVFTVKEPDRAAANYTTGLVAKSAGWK